MTDTTGIEPMSAFADRFKQECIDGSGIALELFDAAIALHSDHTDPRCAQLDVHPIWTAKPSIDARCAVSQ